MNNLNISVGLRIKLGKTLRWESHSYHKKLCIPLDATKTPKQHTAIFVGHNNLYGSVVTN